MAYRLCRVSDQGTALRASDLHNARPTILNPFNITFKKQPVITFRIHIRNSTRQKQPSASVVKQ